MTNSYVITIDGPAGAGKSTVAKLLAGILQFSYLDTGAMYRALTLKAIRNNLNLEDEDALVQMAENTIIDLQGEAEGIKILLDGEDVSTEIRTLEVTNNAFYIARATRVREIMVRWQREIGAKKNIVVEGRDAGTVIFPNAAYKFYLDADLEERAHRRFKELKDKGKTIDENILKTELEERDNKDLNRNVGPLKKAQDAVFINSTNLSIDEVVEKIKKYIKD
jgi:CMP/dCMP kinase